MTIPFKNIPQNLRVPLFYAEIDNSQANTSQQTQRTLIIGQILTGGLAAPNIPLLSQGAGDAINQGGAGSMLALMTAAYRNEDSFGEVWYGPLSDSGSGVVATGTALFAGPATGAGVLHLWVAGTDLAVIVTSGMTAAQIATAVAAAVTANSNLPVTAAAATATTTFTAKNAGPGGNDIDLRMNYRASAAQVTPAGVTVTITAMSAGATAPTLTTLLSNIGDKAFDFIVCPYTDATSISALTAFMNDQTGRWSWSKQLFGGVFCAFRGTLGAATTLGVSLNDQHLQILPFNDSPTPNWIWAASFAAACAVSLRADPARPLHTLTMSTPLPPPIQSRFILTDRNTLLFDGMSTFTVQQGGIVALEGVITTYQKNSFNQADNSYLQTVTLYNLAYILRRLAGVVTSKYSRVKLAKDGTRFAPGSAIVTPKIIRADIISEYRKMEFEGYVQASDVFAANLVVQQNATNPNRVDVLYPAILIDQLDVFALLAQFRLAA